MILGHPEPEMEAMETVVLPITEEVAEADNHHGLLQDPLVHQMEGMMGTMRVIGHPPILITRVIMVTDILIVDIIIGKYHPTEDIQFQLQYTPGLILLGLWKQ